MVSEKLDEKAIFNVARKIDSPDARAEYLHQVCGADQDLFERVETILRAYEVQASFLESPLAGSAPPTSDLAITETPGTVIGPYKLLQQIGEGGMGVVFMAEQTEPIQRTVALKIIKPGMDTRQVIARFEAERQALALMDHPNIAKVLDAGSTDAGRPYFVMELVKGRPITTYCDEHHLTPRERLQLFIPVCQAVQHAHQKGIIHRDLKPSNVMIALYDVQPVPKIIDFGVAKATGQRLTERTMFTEYGAFVGTLEYMSPEQAVLNQLDIDTRSDVYALGVLLYELLTGTPPFDKQQLRAAAFDEMLRIIREDEPPKPSTRLSATDELQAIAANRGMEPKKLSGMVRGELDWVVMKCLEKDRDRRYETASRLAHDIEHYLHEEPVEACPPSPWYRARKFTRRHRVAFSVASTCALALAALFAAGIFARRNQLSEQQRVAENQVHVERLLVEEQQNLLEKVLLQAMNGDFKGAEKTIDEAELLKASTGQLRLLRGMVAYERGDMDPAAKELERAVKLIPVGQPGAVASRALLALSYAKAMHGTNFYSVYKELEPLVPITAEDYLFKGVIEAMLLNGDGRALRYVDEAVRRRPESSVIRAFRTQARANNAMRTGEERDAKLALDDAQIAKTMLPGNKLVLQQSVFADLVAAGIYERLGRADDRARILADARQDVEQLRTFVPSPLAASASFDYFNYVGDEDAAYEMSQHGADIRQVAMLYRRGDFNKALEVVDHNLKLDHGFSMAPVERGIILAELPDGSAQARAAYQDANKHSEGIWRLTPPMILQYLGHNDEAIQAFRTIHEQPLDIPDHLRDWYMKYLDYECDLITADELLQAAAGSLPNKCEAHFVIGLRRLAEGNRAGAREHFQKAVEAHVFPYWEHNWSIAFLERMEKDRNWPTWIRSNAAAGEMSNGNKHDSDVSPTDN